MAYERIQNLLTVIQPSPFSDMRRRKVTNFIRNLLRESFNYEAFPFGSGPLGTYLPDGDIDLTVLSPAHTEEELAKNVWQLLKNEERGSVCCVRDVEHIAARVHTSPIYLLYGNFLAWLGRLSIFGLPGNLEPRPTLHREPGTLRHLRGGAASKMQWKVQLVKCTIDGIPIDISFNQPSGLNALHFKEQSGSSQHVLHTSSQNFIGIATCNSCKLRLGSSLQLIFRGALFTQLATQVVTWVSLIVGKGHLFKQSLLLVKAWGYYETKIIGARHGFLSTYAIENLVIYILNRFHRSLWSPFAVLQRFLEYYSTFDWQNWCVSINGPVFISSLPEVVVTSGSIGDDLLFSQEFLKNCRGEACPDPSLDRYQVKILNIIDPLKHNNNLGRSVWTARRLGEICSLRGEMKNIALDHFFMNTLEKYGRGHQWSGMQASSLSILHRSFRDAEFHRFNNVPDAFGRGGVFPNPRPYMRPFPDMAYGMYQAEHVRPRDHQHYGGEPRNPAFQVTNFLPPPFPYPGLLPSQSPAQFSPPTFQARSDLGSLSLITIENALTETTADRNGESSATEADKEQSGQPQLVPVPSASARQKKSQTAENVEKERFAEGQFKLTNGEDFPPLGQ
ncbi:hypothetical protein ACFE04_029546 [Oxalis oulophora]